MKRALPPHDIDSCRSESRAARRGLEPATRSEADTAICATLVDLAASRGARRVASYLATDGEVDMAELHLDVTAHGVQLFLPVVVGRGEMVFRRHRLDRTLVDGPLGTSHPPPSDDPTSELGDLELVDLAVVPVVGFDRRCNRLGRGGGYYDRALAPFVDRERPLAVGVAYEVQRVDGLVPEAHDVAVDCVVTEDRVYRRG